jgi:hypothetical protein
VLEVDPMKADATTLARGHAELTIVDGVIAYARPGADRPPEPKVEPKPSMPVLWTAPKSAERSSGAAVASFWPQSVVGSVGEAGPS